MASFTRLPPASKLDCSIDDWLRPAARARAARPHRGHRGPAERGSTLIASAGQTGMSGIGDPNQADGDLRPVLTKPPRAHRPLDDEGGPEDHSEARGMIHRRRPRRGGRTVARGRARRSCWHPRRSSRLARGMENRRDTRALWVARVSHPSLEPEPPSSRIGHAATNEWRRAPCESRWKETGPTPFASLPTQRSPSSESAFTIRRSASAATESRVASILSERRARDSSSIRATSCFVLLHDGTAIEEAPHPPVNAPIGGDRTVSD